jgi:uncharacterized protein with PIN domain
MVLFYADENFDKPTVQALRSLGFDVLTVQEAGQRRGGDPQVLAFATQHNRAVLTHDRHDFKRLHRLNSQHAGIVSCTRDADAHALAVRIQAAVAAPAVLAGHHLRVNLPP